MDDAPAPRSDASPLGRLLSRPLAVDVAIAGSVAFVLGVIRLGTPSFWFDEGLTAYETGLSFRDLAERQFHFPYLAGLKAWAGVAGESEWALRFPSVVGLVLACAFTVMLGYRLFDRRTALIAGLLLATSPFLVKWSQQARGYTLLAALAVLAMLLLVRALDRRSRVAWALYGVTFSLVVVWHPLAGMLLLPAHAVLVAQNRERLLPHAPLAGLIIVASAFPWLAIAALRSVGEEYYSTTWLLFPSAEVATRTLLEISGAGGVGLLLAIAGLWVLRRSGRGDQLVLGVWAFSPFAVALAVSVARPVYLDRYLIAAAPAFALLSAVAIVGVASRARAVAVTAAVFATVLGLVRFYAEGDHGNWRGEDWRSAVRAVEKRQHEAGAVVVVPRVAVPVAEYYGADAKEASTADSIWVLVWSEAGGTLTLAERRKLGFGRHRLVARTDFGWRLSAQLWKRER